MARVLRTGAVELSAPTVADFVRLPTATYRWGTDHLKHIIELESDRLSPDIDVLLTQELERRGSAEARRAAFERLLFPVVVVSEPRDAWCTPGLLFWFALREDNSGHNAVRVRRLWCVPHDSVFRGSVDDALSLCENGRKLFIEVQVGPLFSDDVFSGESASLAVALWGRWFVEGLWPDGPIAISGQVDVAGHVSPVEGIEEKLAGARQRGVEWLLTPGDPLPSDPEGLIRVPTRDGAAFFDGWQRDCESALLAHGIRVRPHPRLRGRWGARANRFLGECGRNLAEQLDRSFRRYEEMLQQADAVYQNTKSQLREYADHFVAFCSSDVLADYMGDFEQYCAGHPHDRLAAIEFAKLQLHTGEHEGALTVLAPFEHTASSDVLGLRGTALYKRAEKTGDSAALDEARALLLQAIDLAPDDVDALSTLAGSYRQDDPQQALEYYSRAHRLDPSDPYPLGNMLELTLRGGASLASIACHRRHIDDAIERCRRFADSGQNMPWAHFDIAKFHLLTGESFASLAAYAYGTHISSAAWQLASAKKSLDLLKSVEPLRDDASAAAQMLELGAWARFGQTPSAETQLPAPLAEIPEHSRVLVIVGQCANPLGDDVRHLLHEALADYSGIVVSGGTTAGISGFVGELGKSCNPHIHTIGYVPESLPKDTRIDQRYCEMRAVPSDRFSVQLPIQYWVDIWASGVAQESVRVLNVGGGSLSAFECQLALAQHVGVVRLEPSAEKTGWPFEYTQWYRSPLLELLPCRADSASVTALRRALQLSVTAGGA